MTPAEVPVYSGDGMLMVSNYHLCAVLSVTVVTLLDLEHLTCDLC